MRVSGMSEIDMKRHKNILIIILIGVFLIELEIFAVAMMKSGRQARMHVINPAGDVIYETDGEKLSSFDKYYFENTFGPFEDYDKKLVVRQIPFPFRAWFTAAIGIPLGAVLLLAFIYKAYFTLFGRQEEEDQGDDIPSGKFSSALRLIEGLNIFITGFMVFVAVLAYWIVPNILTFLAKAGADTIGRNKWFFILASLAVFLAFLWIIYLKYKLAARGIDARVELHKYRYKLEAEQGLAKNSLIQYDEQPVLIETGAGADEKKDDFENENV